MNNKIIIGIVVGVLILSVIFFAGMNNPQLSMNKQQAGGGESCSASCTNGNSCRVTCWIGQASCICAGGAPRCHCYK